MKNKLHMVAAARQYPLLPASLTRDFALVPCLTTRLFGCTNSTSLGIVWLNSMQITLGTYFVRTLEDKIIATVDVDG